jgi:hypothetical protein
MGQWQRARSIVLLKLGSSIHVVGWGVIVITVIDRVAEFPRNIIGYGDSILSP